MDIADRIIIIIPLDQKYWALEDITYAVVPLIMMRLRGVKLKECVVLRSHVVGMW